MVHRGVTARDDVNLILAAIGDEAARAGVKINPVAVEGHPADELLKVAEQLHADTIVVGSKGMAGARGMLGSVPNCISHNAWCNVYVAKTP